MINNNPTKPFSYFYYSEYDHAGHIFQKYILQSVADWNYLEAYSIYLEPMSKNYDG